MKGMKRVIGILFLVLVFGLMTACGSSGGSSSSGSGGGGSGGGSSGGSGGQAAQPSAQPSQQATQSESSYSGIVPIYTPPTGNTLYILGAGLGNLMNQANVLPKVRFSTEATNGDTGALEQLLKRHEQGTPAFSANTNSIVSSAYAGTYDVFPGEHPQLRAVATLGINPIHLVVKANSSIQTWADLKGKKIGGFAPGIGPRQLVEALLSEHFGLQPNDYNMIPLDNEDRISGLVDGSVDAVFLLGIPPAPLVTELSRTADVRVVSIDPEILKQFVEKHPYYTYVSVPGGTYAGTNEEVHIPSIRVMMITHDKTPDDIVYELVKMMIENPDKIKEMHKSFDITLDNATVGTDLPFHPGAKKYYEEKGYQVK